jgi:hypothetical protein
MKLDICQRKYGGHDFTVVTVTPADFSTWRRIELWCAHMFGQQASSWNQYKDGVYTPGRWYLQSNRYLFRDPTDATMFAMRWA